MLDCHHVGLLFVESPQGICQRDDGHSHCLGILSGERPKINPVTVRQMAIDLQADTYQERLYICLAATVQYRESHFTSNQPLFGKLGSDRLRFT
jgi:hypothetical protein